MLSTSMDCLSLCLSLIIHCVDSILGSSWLENINYVTHLEFMRAGLRPQEPIIEHHPVLLKSSIDTPVSIPDTLYQKISLISCLYTCKFREYTSVPGSPEDCYLTDVLIVTPFQFQAQTLNHQFPLVRL